MLKLLLAAVIGGMISFGLFHAPAVCAQAQTMPPAAPPAAGCVPAAEAEEQLAAAVAAYGGELRHFDGATAQAALALINRLEPPTDLAGQSLIIAALPFRVSVAVVAGGKVCRGALLSPPAWRSILARLPTAA